MTMDEDTYTDENGDTWARLPEDARFDHSEGAFIVNYTPVFTCGDFYMVEEN